MTFSEFVVEPMQRQNTRTTRARPLRRAFVKTLVPALVVFQQLRTETARADGTAGPGPRALPPFKTSRDLKATFFPCAARMPPSVPKDILGKFPNSHGFSYGFSFFAFFGDA